MKNAKPHKFQNLSEAQIWSKLKDHDKDALAYFFERYYSFLFNYGLKLSSDERMVEDVIQELFYKIWNGGSRMVRVEHPKSYIARAFRNTLIDRISSFGRKENLDHFSFIHETESVQERIIEDEMQAEIRQRIDDSLDQLPARQREIIYLRFYKDMSYQDIADILGINYQSVRNSIHTSIKKLRQALLSAIIFLTGSFF